MIGALLAYLAIRGLHAGPPGSMPGTPQSPFGQNAINASGTDNTGGSCWNAVVMKIIRNEPDILILEQRPLVTGLLVGMKTLIFTAIGMGTLGAGETIGGMMFIGAGVGIGGACFRAFVRRTQLWPDRNTGRFSLKERRMTGMTEFTGPLADIKEAILQASGSSKGGVTRRAALRCVGKTNRIIPLTGIYTNGAGPRRAAQTVNDWLARGTAQRNGKVRQDSAPE